MTRCIHVVLTAPEALALQAGVETLIQLPGLPDSLHNELLSVLDQTQAARDYYATEPQDDE